MAQDDSYEEKPEVISSDSGGSGYSTEIQIVGTVTSSDGSYVEYEIVHQVCGLRSLVSMSLAANFYTVEAFRLAEIFGF